MTSSQIEYGRSMIIFSSRELLVQLKQENRLEKSDEVPEFLKRSISIFASQEDYLVKICKILLDQLKPTADDLEQIGGVRTGVGREQVQLEQPGRSQECS